VNGQRANSNNMTIDGVANIDTGDNGGNMAQTNLDAIAEFKVLTSAYQAEYGRAVGGQVQVVTKSGTNRFSGSAYCTRGGRTGTRTAGRTTGGHRASEELAQRQRLHVRRGRSEAENCSSSTRRSSSAARIRSAKPASRCRPISERAGDFSQSRDVNGNLYPYIRDYTTGLPWQRVEHVGLASSIRASSGGSTRAASTSPR